ncbi:MAG: 5-deoxy-glucuronate isomerase [Spirochaetales bacterium]
MDQYLIHATLPEPDGRVLEITPESANWKYVGFAVYSLGPSETFAKKTDDREFCIVLLSGKADIVTSQSAWMEIGKRESVFERIPPVSVYVPHNDWFRVSALTRLEFAVCSAPGRGKFPARLIRSEDVSIEARGYASTSRTIFNVLPETQPADSLLITEVYTPNGHWSSYPPHRHDVDDLPSQSYLEETYYFRIDPPRNGFAIQRLYEDGDRGVTLTVKDGDTVMVPRGYHPVAAAPGYELYYLNVMAGPRRTWKFHDDPDHVWIKSEASLFR